MGGTMSSVVISGDTSGTITLSAPAVAGTNTITLPATTGTMALTSQLPVSGPVFNVSRASGNQTVSSNTWTKASFDTENFDTDNNFASSTFTPTVAGYYQFNLQGTAVSNPTEAYVYLRKNGGSIAGATFLGTANQWTGISASVQYANGTTDYFEMYIFTSQTQFGSMNYSGYMVRAA
jgi:hypothetical protein